MNINQRLISIHQGFTSTFWIANILELFERLAFYGTKAILTVYLATKIGLAEDAGKFSGWFTSAIFALPIIAGVFVDKYGFKKTLIACFALFSLGYFLIGLAGLDIGQSIVQSIGMKNYVVSVLILTAIGGSLIKPCIVGTVAKTSKEEVKSLGFSIYYTLVNVGGAIGPIIAMNVREGYGIEYVLVMSSITSFLLLIGTLIFFKEPMASDEKENVRTFGQVFKDMALVFLNIRFIGFLVIFSGFWIMFWQIFYSFPFYVTNVLNFSRFELLETVDAWTIILLSVPVTALVKRWSPITAMTIGFFIASGCWFIIGAIPTVTAAIVGVALFALGEATQSPRFYEYVSALAPKEQVGTFMGFAFLPVAIGAFTAGYMADWLRSNYLYEVKHIVTSTTHIIYDPMMWYIVGTIGIVSAILMLLYNLFAVKKTVH
ncbi:MAG: MFS transporter [Ignavibacteriae bacterium]|nr:MFS transporter [Ignavibacteriota bacterium]